MPRNGLYKAVHSGRERRGVASKPRVVRYKARCCAVQSGRMGHGTAWEAGASSRQAVRSGTGQIGGPECLVWGGTRRYAQAGDGVGGLIVTFTLSNPHHFMGLEVGGLGIPLVFQGRWDGLTLPNMARKSAFTEFYCGGHHGFTTVRPAASHLPCPCFLPGLCP